MLPFADDDPCQMCLLEVLVITRSMIVQGAGLVSSKLRSGRPNEFLAKRFPIGLFGNWRSIKPTSPDQPRYCSCHHFRGSRFCGDDRRRNVH